MDVTWLPVPDWEGIYEVSDRGQVRSLPRPVRCRGGKRRLHRGGILTPVIRHKGYPEVILQANGIRAYKFVHRLVLEAHAGPCPPGMESLHGPGGKLDNRWPENLRWGTVSENALDRWRNYVTWSAA